MSSPVTPTYDCYDAEGTPFEQKLLDLQEPSGYTTVLTSQTVYARRGVIPMLNATTLPILESTSGFAIGAAKFQTKLWAQATSASATRKTAATSRYLFPLGEDMSLEPATARYSLRHQYEAVIFRTTPLIALAPLAFGYVVNAGQAELSDITTVGYEIVSRSDVNGGRWTVRARFANAGALQIVQDTGIDPAVTPTIHAELRYDHALTPRLSVWINGTEYGVLSGLASIPVVSTATLHSWGIVQGLSAGGGVGQIDRYRQCRARITEIAA